MTTKTLQNAKNYSNDSAKINFKVKKDYKDLILGGSVFGSSDIDDIYIDSIDSVENALQDTISIATAQIGDVITKTENITPSGFSQVDKWSFTSADPIVFQEETTINILGKTVVMIADSTIENVTIEVQRIIQDYIDEGLYFSKVTVVDNTTLEVEYNDRRTHDPIISLDMHYFNVIKTVEREVIFGYGQWAYLGTHDLTTDIDTYSLYTFKRIG